MEFKQLVALMLWGIATGAVLWIPIAIGAYLYFFYNIAIYLVALIVLAIGWVLFAGYNVLARKFSWTEMRLRNLLTYTIGPNRD